MAKSPGRPSGGKRNNGPGGSKTTSFVDDKLVEFFEDDEDGNNAGKTLGHQSGADGQTDAEGIKNVDDKDAEMADATTNDEEKTEGTTGKNSGKNEARIDRMITVNDTTDDDRRGMDSRGASDLENASMEQTVPNESNANHGGETKEKLRIVRFEKLVKAGKKFSPSRTLQKLLEQIWEADQLAFVEGGTGARYRLGCGAKIPRTKSVFEEYFKMEQVDEGGGLHVGFAFQLVSIFNTNKLKQMEGLKKFLQEEGAWFNDQNYGFESPLTKMIGWFVMVPPNLAANGQFASMVQDAWATHDRAERLLGHQLPYGVFPSLSLRVVKVFADPKKRGLNDVWTFMVEVRCERQYAESLTEIATTETFPDHPIGAFIVKEAANDVKFMTKIITRHNKFVSSLVVIPMEGFCPSLLDEEVPTAPQGVNISVIQFLIGSQSEIEVDGQALDMQMYPGVFWKDDSEETGVVFITTTKLAAKKASEMLDIHVIPMIKSIPSYTRDGLDTKFGPHGIRRKATKVLVTRKKAESQRRDYMEKMLDTIGQADEREEQKFNSYKQRNKRQPIPAEIVWTDEDPPVGKGGQAMECDTPERSFKDVAKSIIPNRLSEGKRSKSIERNQNAFRDDGTSVGEGSGEVSAMTLATLYTTIDEQATTIQKNEQEIAMLKQQAANNQHNAEEHENQLRQQKEYYERQLEKVEKSYTRKFQVAEGNAAMREKTLETRLEEKWEQKLKSTVEEMMKQFSNMHSGEGQFVLLNASPSDSSSITTRTVSHASPDTVVVQTDETTMPLERIQEHCGGERMAELKGGSATASMSTGASTTRVSIAPEANAAPDKKQAKATGQTNKPSKPIFNPYAKTGASQRSKAEDSNSAKSEAMNKSINEEKSTGSNTSSVGSSLARAIATTAGAGTSLARALAKVGQPAKVGSPKGAKAKQAPVRPGGNAPTSKDQPTNTIGKNDEADSMECEEQEGKPKRAKEVSPVKVATPTSHHTHKRSRGRDGSPVRLAAQTDGDRGCAPTEMEVDAVAVEHQEQSGLGSIETINRERNAEGMTSLEVLTPSKQKPTKVPSPQEAPTPVKHNKTPPQPGSPMDMDTAAITDLGSPTTGPKLTPLKATNLAAQMGDKSDGDWESEARRGHADGLKQTQEKTKGKGKETATTITTIAPKEAGPATGGPAPGDHE